MMPYVDSESILSKREYEILNFVSKGLENKEVASQLNISPETVKKHLTNVFSKLQVHNKIQALNKLSLLQKIPDSNLEIL